MLGTSSVGGSLTVVSTLGNLTQTGGADGYRRVVVHDFGDERDDHIEQCANLLTGAVSLNTHGASGNASLTNNRATVLGTSNVGGNLTVTDTVGSLTQTGVLTVAGTSSFTTSATNADITLTGANLLTGAVSLITHGASGNASLTNNPGDGAGGLERPRHADGDELAWRPDAVGSADGCRRVVVHHLGGEHGHRADQRRQPADRRGVAEHQRGRRQCSA